MVFGVCFPGILDFCDLPMFVLCVLLRFCFGGYLGCWTLGLLLFVFLEFRVCLVALILGGFWVLDGLVIWFGLWLVV